MISNSKLAYREHDHFRCQEAALIQARKLCAQAQARLTPVRETVLSLIWQSHRPLGAYKIIEQMSAETGKRVVPPTVYRAIDFLLEHSLIHRIASLNAFIGCPFPGSVHSDVFLVCKTCGIAAECSVDTINSAITAMASRAGFVVESQAIEVIGLCPLCRIN
jgi:Fur family transcriptional regulator, zinc uptake regulator